MGGVNQQEPGESYSKLYIFFKFNNSHTYIPLYVQMTWWYTSNFHSTNVAFTEHNYYWFRIADTIGTSSAEIKTFNCWAEKKAL